MDGYTAWKLHRAIKLHLLTESYDVFESRGRVKNMKLSDYMESRNRNFFETLAKHFEKPNDAVQFFVANIAYTGKDSTFDMASAWDNYVLWIKHKESLTKLICDDLDIIDLTKDLDGNPPKIIMEIMGGRILPETAVAINKYKPFLDKTYFGVGDWPLIIRKMASFIKYNYDTVSKRIYAETI